MKTIISIDGTNLKSFETVSLFQGINDHHHFEVVLDMENIEKFAAHTLDASKDWLGKSIVITYGEREFLGVIVNVNLNHSDGLYGNLVISGYSTTILLEGGKHVQSFLDKDLAGIVKEITQAGGVEAKVKPTNKTPFEYQAQYRETHFQFLQRLAKQHNEWFYYDGVKLIFGKPTLESPIELEYGKDMESISVSIEAIATKQNHFSYNPLEDKREESKTKDKVGGLNELGDFAFNKSKDLFGIVPNSFSDARVPDKDQIDSIIKNKQGSAAARSNVIRASSTKLGLTVGSVIKISASLLSVGLTDTKDYGEYIITSINHTATGLDSYLNHFEAIASGVEYLPEPNVEMPVAESQLATVVSNEDPDKKGRVEVQFQWQTGDMKTSWIRMMSPDAGSSDDVGVNRGFVFIPEKDDQVMVGFRYNDPNRPFVMGSMFTGSTGAGGDDANKSKSITTRSGNTIMFDDDAGSITIVDAKQNLIALDGEGNIVVSSSASIVLSTGKSSLSMDSEGMITLQGKEVTISATDKATVQSEKDVIMNGTKSATVDSPKIVNVSSAKEVMISGTSKATITSSATTAIQGTIIKLN